jgi:hypothetical protein
VGREDKREWWRGWIQLWFAWYIVRTFVSARVCLQHNNKKIQKIVPRKLAHNVFDVIVHEEYHQIWRQSEKHKHRNSWSKALWPKAKN